MEGWVTANDKDYFNHWRLGQLVCECGTHKVYGKSAPYEYHSDWCPIGKEHREQIKNNIEAEKLLKNLSKGGTP